MDTQLITDNSTTIIENNGSNTESTLVLQRVNPNGTKTILNYPKSENIDIDNEVMLQIPVILTTQFQFKVTT